MNGLTLTRPDGSLYDLVLTGQRIQGKEYSNIDDPDAYRALVDTAQIALENHDFGAYQRARHLLATATFMNVHHMHGPIFSERRLPNMQRPRLHPKKNSD